jgi:phage/plasmid-associated DNA primase
LRRTGGHAKAWWDEYFGSIGGRDRWLRAPTSVLAPSEEWRAEADPLTEFLAARCVLQDEASALSGQLYSAYQEWAGEEGLRDKERLTSTAFGRRMGARFVGKRTSKGKRYHGVGVRMTG